MLKARPACSGHQSKRGKKRFSIFVTDMAELQLYRQATIGDCLAEALDEMVTNGKLPGDLATKIMAEVCAMHTSCADSRAEQWSHQWLLARSLTPPC